MRRIVNSFLVSFGIIGVIALYTLYAAVGVGWAFNLYNIAMFVFHPPYGQITAQLLLQLVGIFAYPLGAIMGFVYCPL